MYSIASYGSMITDVTRMTAYVQALRQAVTPGCVVVDIGTGTGIFALLACQFGAGKVYALEPADVIHVACESAAANGYAERIECIQQLSTHVTLPKRADVIIADLHGWLPLYQYSIPSLIDARQRLLAPDGVLIPQQETLWAAVVEAPDLYREYTAPWRENTYSLDMRAAEQLVLNTWGEGRVKPDQLLVEPHCWATLDYATVESPNYSAEVTWQVARAGIGHGLNIWFDTRLGEGVGFSNAPGASAPCVVYGSAFFPWTTPVSLDKGDEVCVTLQTHLVDGDYVWGWDTRVFQHGMPRHIKANFKQSTFLGVPLGLSQVRKREMTHIAQLTPQAQVTRRVLDLMDGQTALGDIARIVYEQFPDQFRSWQEALDRVGEISGKYCQ